jgi:hypothetical protein
MRVCGMVANTAKSRSAANQNMANNMVQEEQAHHLRYVLPTDPHNTVYTHEAGQDIVATQELAKALINGLEGTVVDAPYTAVSADECPSLIAPARVHSLKDPESRSLARDILCLFGNEAQANIPTRCTRWTGAWCYNDITGKVFKVVSQQMRRPNSTRCNAIIRFELQRPGQVEMTSSFGRVEFFLELPAMPGWPTGLQVAYVQTFQVALDGRLVYIVREGGMQMVLLKNIKELMGLFVWEGDEYLLNSRTSLLL